MTDEDEYEAAFPWAVLTVKEQAVAAKKKGGRPSNRCRNQRVYELVMRAHVMGHYPLSPEPGKRGFSRPSAFDVAIEDLKRQRLRHMGKTAVMAVFYRRKKIEDLKARLVRLPPNA